MFCTNLFHTDNSERKPSCIFQVGTLAPCFVAYFCFSNWHRHSEIILRKVKDFIKFQVFMSNWFRLFNKKPLPKLWYWKAFQYCLFLGFFAQLNSTCHLGKMIKAILSFFIRMLSLFDLSRPYHYHRIGIHHSLLDSSFRITNYLYSFENFFIQSDDFQCNFWFNVDHMKMKEVGNFVKIDF